MDAEDIRLYAMAKDGAEEDVPFGPDTLVFKVQGKIFLLMSMASDPLSFNAKCDPDHAVQLREDYPESVLPGYHMNKKHWNTVIVPGLKAKLIRELIDESYALVTATKTNRK